MITRKQMCYYFLKEISFRVTMKLSIIYYVSPKTNVKHFSSISLLHNKVCSLKLLFRDILRMISHMTSNVATPFLRNRVSSQQNISIWALLLKTYLEQLYCRFVVVTNNKASNDFAFICKKLYITKLMSEIALTVMQHVKHILRFQLPRKNIPTLLIAKNVKFMLMPITKPLQLCIGFPRCTKHPLV